jgi:hypothetical protein
VASRRTGVLAVTACVAIGLAAIGVGGAVAQQDDETAAPAADPTALVERLGELEPLLPDTILPTTVTIDPEATGGEFGGDAAGLRATLDTVEDDLRQLFIDADDSGGEVADAISIIARGWLDIWHGAERLAEADAHDLAFPLDTETDQGVATGADELRGHTEAGLELILQGQARHLEGYTVLRDEAPAEAAVQASFDARAVAAEDFDTDLRPELLALLSQRSTGVLIAVDRFDTDLPGVEPRATSTSYVCIDRDLLRESGGVVTDENIAELVAATPERTDCPDLPAEDE